MISLRSLTEWLCIGLLSRARKSNPSSILGRPTKMESIERFESATTGDNAGRSVTVAHRRFMFCLGGGMVYTPSLEVGSTKVVAGSSSVLGTKVHRRWKCKTTLRGGWPYTSSSLNGGMSASYAVVSTNLQYAHIV